MAASAHPNRRPLLALILLSPIIAEMLSGSSPPLEWLNPITPLLLIWLYGAGVLVMRETAVRWKTGWPSILLLGAAYGIIEEGLAVKSFFDPGWMDLGTLAWYGRWLDVNWVWAVWLTIYHAVVSIAIPIFLMEWIWPRVRGQPLTSRRGYITAIALLAGATIFIDILLTPYRPSVWHLLDACAAASMRARRAYHALVHAALAESFMISPVVRHDMTTAADFRSIYQYNWQVLRDYGEALAKLPREELIKNREATHGSMKNIFHHILSVHDGWLNVAAQGTSADPAMREKDFDQVASMEPLRAYLEKIIAKEASFLASLRDKDLGRRVKPEWKERSHQLQNALMQVTFEQAHHIGELIALFWQIDVEPPEMTWIDVRLAMKGDPGPS